MLFKAFSVFLILTLCIAFPDLSRGQDKVNKSKQASTFRKDLLKHDTLRVQKGIYFISPTSYLSFPRDTTIVIASLRKLRPEEINRLRSQALYDSLYSKMGKNKISSLLYNLAFVPPRQSSLPDTVQRQKIEIPFRPYQGMFIKEVTIKSLGPFGTSIFDTSSVALTRMGKFGNQVHLITRKSIIRKQLMFKSGERVNADLIADNLRILKDLSYLSDARILISETSPESDTVDIIVITKDNWSIGATWVLIDLGRSRGSLYDANFLGSGDRLSVYWSTNYKRAPYFRFDGISYKFTNIMGSFIDGDLSLSQDNDGNQTLYAGLSKPFYSYSTNVAGGINFTLAKSVSPQNDTLSLIGTYHQEAGWLGLSMPLSSSDPSIRMITAQSIMYRSYMQRPMVTADSNAGFYNTRTFLTSLQISKSRFYNTDYILEFGQTETFPYGFLGQITAGPAITDFYTRFYLDAGLTAGNFINSFGYLAGNFNLGGFLNRDSLEDGLLKIDGSYMSYLYFSASKRFKFRSYVSAKYIRQFRQRKNNGDTYNFTDGVNINSVDDHSYFYATEAAWFSISTVAYVPWYFYGFRFALQGTVWAGLSAPEGRSLWDSRFMTGVGAGLLFKNNNLIFPTIMISCFIYPTTPGVPLVQFNMFETGRINTRDFGPTAPYIQSMNN